MIPLNSETKIRQRKQRRWVPRPPALLIEKLKSKSAPLRDMTIAAGFNFDNGLLIAADTQHGAGYRLQASKIFTKDNYPNGIRSVFAFSGDMYSARMCIQHCEAGLGQLRSTDNALELRAMIEQQVENMYANTIPACPDPAAAAFDLVVGMWSPSSGLHAYSSRHASVIEFPGYALTGAGEYLGHYLIRPRYGPTASLEDAVLLATTALTSIKTYDENCGGNSELVVLSRDGAISNVEQLDISQGENLTNRFWTAANRLLAVVAKPTASQEQIDEAQENFTSDIEAARRHAQATRNLQATVEKLGKDTALRIQRDSLTKLRHKRQGRKSHDQG